MLAKLGHKLTVATMANGCLLESWCMYKCRFAVDQAAKAAAPSEFELLEPVSRKDTSTVWQANGTQSLARVNLPRGGLSLTRLREAFGSVGVVSNPRFLSRAERIQARTLPGILLGVVSWPMNMKFTSSIALWSCTQHDHPTYIWWWCALYMMSTTLQSCRIVHPRPFCG